MVGKAAVRGLGSLLDVGIGLRFRIKEGLRPAEDVDSEWTTGVLHVRRWPFVGPVDGAGAGLGSSKVSLLWKCVKSDEYSADVGVSGPADTGVVLGEKKSGRSRSLRSSQVTEQKFLSLGELTTRSSSSIARARCLKDAALPRANSASGFESGSMELLVLRGDALLAKRPLTAPTTLDMVAGRVIIKQFRIEGRDEGVLCRVTRKRRCHE